MKKFFCTLAVLVALSVASLSASAADSSSPPVKAAKVPATASAKYFHRVTTYLKSVKLTDEETAAIAKLETAAAPSIDSDDPAVAKAAKAKLHNDVILALTVDQQAALKTAHARKPKTAR